MIRSNIEFLNEDYPVLALAIHNGHEMHSDLIQMCGITEADRLREEDPYTEIFANAYPNKIVVYTSRFTVDLNRRREQAIYQNPEDCWGLQARLAPLPDSLVTDLLRDYGQWYSLLTFSIKRLLDKNPFLLVLDLHSYNHRRQGENAPADSQNDNPDIILGRNNMPIEFYPWVEKLRAQIDKKDVSGRILDCRIDVKFTGGWLCRWLHQTFPYQVLCLAVEFKKIFMNEWTGELDKEMQDTLSNILYQAVEHCRQELVK